jgi:indolepyruvate ferredoxin oxidoreductase
VTPTEPDNVVAFARPVATLDDIVASRMKLLAAFQNAALADRYRSLVEKVRDVEQKILPGESRLAEAVARNYAKLLAYKDEYEVARLYTDTAFVARLDHQFEGNYTLKFHLAPPLFARRDPRTGHLVKQEYGPWMLPVFRLLAKLKVLRGTMFDPFGRTAERRQERALIDAYERLIDELLAGLAPTNHALAVELAAVPDDIRGYGHVKQAHLEKAKRKEADLLVQWRHPGPLKQAAE